MGIVVVIVVFVIVVVIVVGNDYTIVIGGGGCGCSAAARVFIHPSRNVSICRQYRERAHFRDRRGVEVIIVLVLIHHTLLFPGGYLSMSFQPVVVVVAASGEPVGPSWHAGSVFFFLHLPLPSATACWNILAYLGVVAVVLWLEMELAVV